MNLIADAMEPYLREYGIEFTRNKPEMTLRQAINQSNSGSYDRHLASHSNAAGAQNSGQVTGVQIYYYPTSARGKKAAEIIAKNYTALYPDPSRIQLLPTTALGEVRLTKAPAVLIETAYHDNVDDARWIRENIDNIARNLAESVKEIVGR